MQSVRVIVEIEYDRNRVTKNEVVFNLKRALSDYFERYDDYDGDAFELKEVRLEDASNVSRGDS